jgi:hypothetical protein
LALAEFMQEIFIASVQRIVGHGENDKERTGFNRAHGEGGGQVSLLDSPTAKR